MPPPPKKTLTPAEEAGPLSYLDDDFYARQGFSSDLATVVLHQDKTAALYAPGEALPKTSRTFITWSQRETIDPQGLREREKLDYTLTFPEEAGSVQNEWQLLGNAYDKSLLRNYLALSIAGELGLEVPQLEFCEVLVQEEDGYRYQGVYLLAAPLQTSLFTLKRNGGPSEDSLLFESHGIQSGAIVDPLYIQSANEISPEDIARIEAGINTAEKSIFAWDYNEFSKYGRYVDETKVYDYFLIYELFGNYSAAYSTSYLYDADQNVFWPIPSLDFEFSVDNAPYNPMDIYDTRMPESPYYASWAKYTNFIQELISRYKLLYQDILSSSSINSRIDEASALIADAQQRDWARWKAMYDGTDMYWLLNEEADANPQTAGFDRNSYSYDQEIVKLKYSISEHGRYMFAGIAELYDQEKMIGDDAPYVKNTWMFLVALAVIIIAVRIVRRRTR